MRYLSKEAIEGLRRLYPKGTRLRLDREIRDPYSPVPAGTQGTVFFVDDIGRIHMEWDTGSTLDIIPSLDAFTVL